MVVKTLLQILEKYPLNRKGVKIQFVGHRNGSLYSDTVYHDCVKVTPIADDGELLRYRSRYFHNPKFTNWEMRSAFYQLVDRYNQMNCAKPNFVPLNIFTQDEITLK